MILRLLDKYKAILVIIGIALYYFLLRETTAEFLIRKGDIGIAVIILGIVLEHNFRDTMKQNSPQITYVKGHNSLGQGPFRFTENGLSYNLFRLGGSTYIIPKAGREGVLVAPEMFSREYSDNYVIDAIPVKVNKSKLPSVAQSYISHYNLNPPYYYALIPVAEIGIKKRADVQKSIESYADKIHAQNEVITMLKNMLDMELESVDKFASKASKWAQSFHTDKQNVIERIRDK